MNLESLLILAVCTFGPAVVIIVIYSIKQKRRSQFPRQRITKGIKTRSKE
jgi:hypothetical protein